MEYGDFGFATLETARSRILRRVPVIMQAQTDRHARAAPVDVISGYTITELFRTAEKSDTTSGHGFSWTRFTPAMINAFRFTGFRTNLTAPVLTQYEYHDRIVPGRHFLYLRHQVPEGSGAECSEEDAKGSMRTSGEGVSDASAQGSAWDIVLVLERGDEFKTIKGEEMSLRPRGRQKAIIPLIQSTCDVNLDDNGVFTIMLTDPASRAQYSAGVGAYLGETRRELMALTFKSWGVPGTAGRYMPKELPFGDGNHGSGLSMQDFLDAGNGIASGHVDLYWDRTA